MNTEPLPFLQDDLPSLFNRGVAALRERAEDGDEKAQARLADVEGASGAIRVVLEGDDGGELYIGTTNAVMSASEEAPEGLPIRHAIAVSAEAVEAALEEIEDSDEIDEDKAVRRITRIVSAEAETLLATYKLLFHVILKDVPDLDEVKLRIALGGDTPPDDPEFTATVSWDDIEDLRAGELTPQQLFGRLRLAGDASKAMALGMTLMQKAQERQRG